MHDTVKYDIALIGCGMRGHWQLTIEQIAALRAAKHIYLAQSIPHSMKDFVGVNCRATVTSLEQYCNDGEERTQAFMRMTSAVTSCALQYGNTAIVTYGHPLIYSYLGHSVLMASRQLGLTPVVYSGVSSIDEILSLLEIDCAARSLQIVNAEALLSNSSIINPDNDLMVMRVGCIGVSRFHTSTDSFNATKSVSAYSALQVILEHTYSPAHLITVIYIDFSDSLSTPVPSRSRHRFLRVCTLADFASIALSLHTCHTLFIPSVISGCSLPGAPI